MKQRESTRIVSLLLALMLCIPLCLYLAGGNQASAASNRAPGIFALRMENKSEYSIVSAFLLYDEATDCQYILADPSVATYAEQGFTLTLLAEGYSLKAECLGHDGYFAYLKASGMSNFTPLLLSSNDSEQIYIFVQSVDEKETSAAGTEFVYCDIRDWTKEGIVYVAPNQLFSEVVGAPAVKDMSTFEVVGTIGGYEGKVAFYPAANYAFPNGYSVESQSGEKPADSGDDQKDAGSSVHPALLVGIAVIVVFAIVSTQKKKKSGSGKEEMTSQTEGTVALDMGAQMNNNFAPLDMATSIPAQWQIRGMGGPIDGRIFLLTSTLRMGRSPQNDVVFSSNTPGISGNHCQLSFEHGRVVLRDLQSTYGTYMGSHMKLEPQISYNLQNGDTFTLAEGAQTFRLERSGNAVQDMTPAVRSNADGRTYRADMNGCISFGRDPRNQVPFDQNDSSVSTNHCVLYRENGQLYLKDTNSTNGTFFDADNRLKPNKPYKVRKGMSFFLVSPQNTFVITED